LERPDTLEEPGLELVVTEGAPECFTCGDPAEFIIVTRPCACASPLCGYHTARAQELYDSLVLEGSEVLCLHCMGTAMTYETRPV